MSMLKNMIVIEGLDGAGTTTQMKLLAQKLENLGKNVYQTHEPTDNPVGRLIRSVLQKKVTLPPLALAYLYASDREDHLYNKEYGVINHLEKGEIVISDRYFYSSIAYQSVECDKEQVKNINARFPSPEYLIFVDTPAENCLGRIEKRGEEKELFDKFDFLSIVRKNYLAQLENINKETKCLIVDGLLSIDEISSEIFMWLKNNG